MSKPIYSSIVEHYERCLNQYGDSHKGVDWPNQTDADIRYQVMLDVVRDPRDRHSSILDFGCGASHLYGFMLSQKLEGLKYYGLDISEKFCALSRGKYPDNEYLCFDVIEEPSRLGSFDYIVMNGVFTEKRELSFEDMLDYFKRLISLVFEKANKGIAFNVMSPFVDWERDDLFHLPVELLLEFLNQNLSRNVILRADYGLYEYTAYVYKDALGG